MIDIRWIIGAFLALALGAAAVVGLGLYNVSARTGHWPVTGWAMHLTFQNAVTLRAPPEFDVPPLQEEALVRLGAGHFANACVQCHGAPGIPRPATVRSMLPEPPPITEAIEGWEPRDLHWIVFNGVKMTGMPAWPAPRPDEVWAIVAFLAAVREMDAASYAALVTPEAAPPGTPPALARCSACHGANGVGVAAPYVPRLDIQNPGYLALSLGAYRAGARASGVMEEVASALSDTEIDALASYYGGLEPVAVTDPGREAALIAEGEALASAASADPDVPACRSCHGPGARNETPAPALAGQHRAYLERQLALWRSGVRGGGPRANVMHKVAATLSEADAAALAAYYAALPPRKGTTAAE